MTASTRKGILLAGGSGTRLYPATRAISKQLMPVYDKPMIYYPLSTLMLAGLREFLIISTPHDLPLFERLLGDGSAWGLSFHYAVQEQPNGLAEAFRIGRAFIGRDEAALVLGDNLYHGHGLPDLLRSAARKKEGASVFAYHVANPQAYGVLAFDAKNRPVDVVEKPIDPPSNWAVTGLYFYDNDVLDIARDLQPSARGELEITDVNRVYLQRGKMEAVRLGRGFAWLDTGTHESLADATNFVRLVEERQAIKIGCPEEIAFANGYIDAAQVERLAAAHGKTAYGAHLRRLIEEN